MTDLSQRRPDPLDIALGSAIRLRRRAAGVSQERLAEACGISFQQVQKYESGVNRVSFSRLIKIAEALDCRASDLISAIEARPESPLPDEPDPPSATPRGQDLAAIVERLPSASRWALLSFLKTLTPEQAASQGG